MATVTLPPSFRSKLFDALLPTEVKAVLSAATEKPTSLAKSSSGKEIWLIIWSAVNRTCGHYRLWDEGSKLFVRWGLPGDVFGLWTLLPEPSRYQLTVEAVQEGALLTWDRTSSRRFFGQFPNMPKAVNSLAAGFMNDFGDALAVRSSFTAPRRLAQMLVKGASQIGRVGGGALNSISRMSNLLGSRM